MGDIDFDELDKAVNNLMGNVKPGKDDEPKEKKLEVKDTLKPGELPEYEKLSEAAEKIGSETLSPESEETFVEQIDTDTTEPVDQTDMPTQNTDNDAQDNDDKKSSDESSKSVVEETSNDPKEESAPADVAAVSPTGPAKRSANGRFMDVVRPSSDMRTPSPVTPVTPGGRGLMSHRQTVIASPRPSVVSEDYGSTTPFLPDANEKVEKRPLGAIQSPFEGAPDEPEKIDDGMMEKIEDAEPAVIETSSINNETIEHKLADGEDIQQLIDPTEISPQASLEQKKLQEVESVEVVDETNQNDTIEKVESGDTEHLRTAPKEHTKKNGEEATAIFDPKEYHQPLGHPQKQKSGWGKVLISILIIVIFAAAGGAAYFLLG